MTRCDHNTSSHDYQSFNELDGTLSIHTVCDACCETLEVKEQDPRSVLPTITVNKAVYEALNGPTERPPFPFKYAEEEPCTE